MYGFIAGMEVCNAFTELNDPVDQRTRFENQEKLREFYNRRGYIDFNVIVARGDLLPDFSGFNINFIINEGIRYTIDKVKINSSLIDDIKNKKRFHRDTHREKQQQNA